MAAHVPGVWGIDLGQCALKAIRLEMKDGQAIATAFDYIEHPKILSQPDADPDQLTREALEQFLSRNSLRGDAVVISVPGQSGLARFVKLPPVEEKKIADIVRFEAKQQIPFPLEEVVWDFQKLSSGSLSGDFVETEIGLFAMKREMVNRALQQFKEVNVEVHVIQMAPLALCNFIGYDQLGRGPGGTPEGEEENAKKQCVVALDMGTDSSNLVITDAGKIIWQRPIPIGGNHFTRALTKDLKLTFAKAEHLKRNAAKSPDLRKILASLKSVLNDFVGEVQRSLGYFTNTHRDAQIQYMVGLGNAFRLPGLKQFLQEKLQLEVKKLGKFERLSGDAVTAAPTFSENVMGFGVAYGLSLQGLKQARLQTNLLPHEVRVERLVRGKKPWAAAAVASLLIAVAGLALFKGMENSYVVGSDIDREKKALEGVIKRVSTARDAYTAEENKIKKSQDVLVSLAAGTKERLNWQLLHEYINYALPLPNGERLADVGTDLKPIRKRYLTPAALDAYKLLEARRFPDPKKAVDKNKAIEEDQKIKKNLIQINIEGIMQLYTDDLGPYFRKIHSETSALFGMDNEEKNRVVAFVTAKDQDAKDKSNLPKAGWVIEIRGYTYHKDGMVFVMSTLVENLRSPEYRRNEAWYKAQPADVRAQIDEMDVAIRKNIGYVFVYKYGEVRNPEAGNFQIIGEKSDLRTLIASDTAGGGGGSGAAKIGGGLGGPPGGGTSGGMPGAQGAAETKEDPSAANAAKREGWVPIGDIASSVLGAASGGTGTGGSGGIVGAGGPGAAGIPGGGKKGSGPLGGLGGPGGTGPAPSAPTAPTEKEAPAGIELQPRTEFVVLLVWREPDRAAAQPTADNTPPAADPTKK
jgi:type IV pilus assembly protein PilM